MKRSKKDQKSFGPLQFPDEIKELLTRRPDLPRKFTAMLTGSPEAKDAVAAFRRWAGSGLTEARFAMGYCCEHGYGTSCDIETAKDWYDKTESQTYWDLGEYNDPIEQGYNIKGELFSESNVLREWLGKQLHRETKNLPGERDVVWYRNNAEEAIRLRNRKLMW